MCMSPFAQPCDVRIECAHECNGHDHQHGRQGHHASNDARTREMAMREKVIAGDAAGVEVGQRQERGSGSGIRALLLLQLADVLISLLSPCEFDEKVFDLPAHRDSRTEGARESNRGRATRLPYVSASPLWCACCE